MRITQQDVLSNEFLGVETKEMLLSFMSRVREIPEDVLSELKRAESFFRFNLIDKDTLTRVYRDNNIPLSLRYVILKKMQERKKR